MSFNLRTLLVVLLLLGVTITISSVVVEEEESEECSGHGKLHGNHCHCAEGFKSEGVECIPSSSSSSCPAGGIAWELSMALALENGTYDLSFVDNTENMAMFVLPMDVATSQVVTMGDLEASVEQTILLLDDVALPRHLVKASRDMAPTEKLLYIIQRNNAKDLAALRAECEANPDNTWHMDHCDGPGGHGRRRLAAMSINLVVNQTGYYAFHIQHNAIEEFGMRLLDSSGQEVEPELAIAEADAEAPSEKKSSHRKASASVWGKTMGAVAIVAILSIVGIFLLILRISALDKMMDAMVALSAGALFGAAFLHILPESIEFYSEYGQMELTLSSMFTFGFVVAMIVEMALELWMSKVQTNEGEVPMSVDSPMNDTPAKHSKTSEADDYSNGNLPILVGRESTKVSPFSLTVNWRAIKPMAYIILIGDLFHNFVDGVLIATAFLACDDTLGVSVTVSSILHELPQEFADFIILVESGFTPFQAVLFNFASALTAFIGAAVVLAAVPVTNETMGLLLAVGSGTLVYIAGTDLLPGVLRVKSFGQFAVHLFMFTVGVGALALTTLHHVHCNAD